MPQRTPGDNGCHLKLRVANVSNSCGSPGSSTFIYADEPVFFF